MGFGVFVSKHIMPVAVPTHHTQGLWIGTCCPLRHSTQQLTHTDAKTHSKTVDGAWETYGKGGERIVVLEGIENPQEDQQSQLTWTLGALRI